MVANHLGGKARALTYCAEHLCWIFSHKSILLFSHKRIRLPYNSLGVARIISLHESICRNELEVYIATNWRDFNSKYLRNITSIHTFAIISRPLLDDYPNWPYSQFHVLPPIQPLHARGGVIARAVPSPRSVITRCIHAAISVLGRSHRHSLLSPIARTQRRRCLAVPSPRSAITRRTHAATSVPSSLITTYSLLSPILCT